MHLFILGLPQAGKTTLIKRLIPFIRKDVDGFYTEEIKDKGKRVGFQIKTIKEKKEAIFSHCNFKTPYKVSSYYVDLKVFEKIAVETLKEALINSEYVVIDEIGKMEILSREFKKTVEEALKRKKVIATLPLRYEDRFISQIKKTPFSYRLILRKDNFEEVLRQAQLFLEALPKEKIKELDRKAGKLGLEERILIENASSNLFFHINQLNLGKRCLIVAGWGNNGADTLACARKLLSNGYEVDIAVVREKEPNQEVKFQLSILEKFKKIYFIKEEKDLEELKKIVQKKDFILEGILGIGIKGELSSLLKEVIQFINESGKKIISCDIPSGLFPDEGVKYLPVVKADYTVTFLAPKLGFFLNQGDEFAGKIIVTDIGLSLKILEDG